MKLRWPGLKILDRYIIGKFLSTYFFSIALIIVVIVIFDYAEKIDNFTVNNAPFKAIVFDYYLNFVPSFINQFSGLFAFIAVIFFTSKLAYQTEIIAMLSGGMSFKRLMWPYFIGALVIASLSLSLNLWIVPISQKTCVEFESMYVKKNANTRYDRNIYRQIEPGLFIYLRNLSIHDRASFLSLERYEDGQAMEFLEAANVSLDSVSGRWRAARFTIREFAKDGQESFNQYRNLDTLINISRSELGNVADLVKTMKIDELNEFLAEQKRRGSDSIKVIEVAKHTRYAFPAGTFILTLIGVSMSSRKVRGGTGLHIGIGTGLCFSYILFTRFFEEFAKGGTIPPDIAVWIPNIIYVGIAIYCYTKAPK